MKTIFKESIYSILRLFYENKNDALHLRDIARKAKLNESTVTTRLNQLEEANILSSKKDGNLKKFIVKNQALKIMFPLFDHEKLERLHLLRKNAVREYLDALVSKPLLAVVFGSTAKGSYKEDSDLDILAVFQKKTDTKKAKKHAQSLTGIRIQEFKLLEDEFYKELKYKQDHVVQSALNTGFPVFNYSYFYEVKNE
jgi:predicted nucleotidyltransferase